PDPSRPRGRRHGAARARGAPPGEATQTGCAWSGRLSEPRLGQFLGQGSRVLEVPYALEGQIEEMRVRHEQRDEVERRRDYMHRGNEERIQEPLALRGDPFEFLSQTPREAFGEERGHRGSA